MSFANRLKFISTSEFAGLHCACVSPVAPPTSLPLQGGPGQRKKLSAPRISLSLDQSEDDLEETPDDLDINVDELDTPDEGDCTDPETDWEGDSAPSEAQFAMWFWLV